MSDRRTRRIGPVARWAAGVAAAALLVAGGAVLGSHLAGPAGAVAGTPSASARLVALSSNLSGESAHSLKSDLAGLRKCLARARKLAKEGHRAAAWAKERQCIRKYHAGGLLLLRALFKHGAEYGQVTFKAKNGTKTVAFEQGVVQSTASGSFTLKAGDGTTWTWDVVKNTVTLLGRKLVSATKLAQGQRVFVAGTVVGGADDARLIIIRG